MTKCLSVHILKLNDQAKLPQYSSTGAAGADIFAFLAEPVTIKPLEYARIPTGIAIELPSGYEAQVRPRSGLAYSYGITILNAPGTIDEDYRGEIGVLLINLGKKEYTIKSGDRIAQLVIAPFSKVRFIETGALSVTNRNDRGFGSTGSS